MKSIIPLLFFALAVLYSSASFAIVIPDPIQGTEDGFDMPDHVVALIYDDGPDSPGLEVALANSSGTGF